ncbi:MAG: hypothetical protein JWO89_2225, partial [Verrucomicrobiaceae bacterium]|nr:hypothetical protein [Verrucomicrobiaceae bacterium]
TAAALVMLLPSVFGVVTSATRGYLYLPGNPLFFCGLIILFTQVLSRGKTARIIQLMCFLLALADVIRFQFGQWRINPKLVAGGAFIVIPVMLIGGWQAYKLSVSRNSP